MLNLSALSATPVTLLLLILNVLISVYALYLDPSQLERLSFRPREVLREREYYRFLTAGFVHVGLWHLLFNLWALYLFGPILELELGSFAYLIVYLGAELAAHGLTLLVHRDNPHYASVGASGAVSGVIFGFCLFYPTSGIGLIFIPGLFIDAWIFALAYVAISIFAMQSAQRRGEVGGIAHEAHLGGALGGLLLTVLFEPSALMLFWSQVF